MKIAQEIYTEYKIMPSLQLHQLRVASVAKLICNNFTKPVNEKDVVLACLFHDMGNIIKSDITYFPEFAEPEGIEYWEKVKAEFVAKYGPDHHAACAAIAREIGLPPRAVELVEGIGYSKLGAIVDSQDWEQKIAEYADTRVGPRGVLPLEERLVEGRTRYLTTATSRPHYDTEAGFEKLAQTAGELERQVSGCMHIKPNDIDDASITTLIEDLRSYSVD